MVFSLYSLARRERHEFRVFKDLLRMVPGLEERLIEGNEEDAQRIAESVSAVSVSVIWLRILKSHSFKKVYPVPVPMTQKA